MSLPISRGKLFALMLVAALTVSLLAMLLLAEFHEEITEPFLSRLDVQLMSMLHTYTSPLLTAVARGLSWIGSPVLLVPTISFTALLLWMLGLRRDALLLLVGIGGSGVLDIALKLHFRRVRPEVPWALATEHSFSFPSGHSVAAVVLYGLLTYLVWGRLSGFWERVAIIAAGLLLVAGIGVSRVYLGVHFPTDVAAGYGVGLLWLIPVIGGSEFIVRQEQYEEQRQDGRDSSLTNHPV